MIIFYIILGLRAGYVGWGEGEYPYIPLDCPSEFRISYIFNFSIYGHFWGTRWERYRILGPWHIIEPIDHKKYYNFRKYEILKIAYCSRTIENNRDNCGPDISTIRHMPEFKFSGFVVRIVMYYLSKFDDHSLPRSFLTRSTICQEIKKWP